MKHTKMRKHRWNILGPGALDAEDDRGRLQVNHQLHLGLLPQLQQVEEHEGVGPALLHPSTGRHDLEGISRT